MLALNSPSVSPTILITIPFGRAEKATRAALVLIKKSECARLGPSTARLGEAPWLITLQVLPFLNHEQDDALTPGLLVKLPLLLPRHLWP